MPLFRYQTIDANGVRSEGTQDAKDRFALYHAVKKDGLVVVSAEEVPDRFRVTLFHRLPLFNKTKTHQKIIFARNLSKMVEAGLPVVRGLSILEKDTSGDFKKVLRGLQESISSGNTLGASMKSYPKVFSGLMIPAVLAGEESGNLSGALKNVALEIEKTYKQNKKIKRAFLYPVVTLFFIVYVVLLAMVYIAPTLSSTFSSFGLYPDLSIRVIIATSNFVVSYSFYVALVLVVFILAVSSFAKTYKGQRFFDFILIETPFIGDVVKQLNSARTMRALSTLLASGVDIISAIRATKGFLTNSYYKDVLGEAEETLQKGGSLSLVFSAHNNLYPVFVSEMASAGEESGKMADTFLSAALFYEEELKEKTKNIYTFFETIFVAGSIFAVGFLVLSIVKSLYLATSILFQKPGF